MAAPGAQYNSLLGPDTMLAEMSVNGIATYAMAALNTGWCARFMATSTADIASVRLNWSSVASVGVVELRIETIDATTGKPSGTLYDANATYNITPVAGTQTYTFATLPTTGLVVGNEYGVVLLTTTAGTTQTLSSRISQSPFAKYPAITLTAVDGTTRSNFAEIVAAVPIISIVDENSNEFVDGFFPYVANATSDIYGASIWAASKITINTSVDVRGVAFCMGRNGTPAGDLRVRIMDSSNNVITGTTVTADKDSLVNASTRRYTFYFPTVITLTAGTYRIVFDSASSANSSNDWFLRSGTFLNANSVNPHRLSTTINAGTAWTDSTTTQAMVWLFIDNLVSAGGSTSMKVHPGMNGGLNG